MIQARNVSALVVGSSTLFFACASGAPLERVVLLQPVREVTNDPGYSDSEPAPSPDGKLIVFSRGQMNGRMPRRIWSVAVDGGQPKPVTPAGFERNCTRPSWSRDGRWLAFRGAPSEVNGRARGGIWMMPSAGGSPREVSRDPLADDYYPQWFPEGRRLAVLRDVPGHDSDVWILALDGDTQRVTTHPAFDGKPTISPDGTQLAFPSDRDGTRNIWIVPVGEPDETARQLTFDGGRGPAWSPDGEWIAYGCPTTSSRYALCLTLVRGGDVVQVTDGNANDFNPEWGPDGTWVAVGREAADGRGVIAIVGVAAVVQSSGRYGSKTEGTKCDSSSSLPGSSCG